LVQVLRTSGKEGMISGARFERTGLQEESKI